MNTLGKSIAYLILGIAFAAAGIAKGLLWLIKTLVKGCQGAGKYAGLTIYWTFRFLLWELPIWIWQEPLTSGKRAFAAGFSGPLADHAAQRRERQEKERNDQFLASLTQVEFLHHCGKEKFLDKFGPAAYWNLPNRVRQGY